MKQPPTVGDVVEYHGWRLSKRGEYVVAAVPADVHGRGYVLYSKEEDRDMFGMTLLRNVHRDSFTLIEKRQG